MQNTMNPPEFDHEHEFKFFLFLFEKMKPAMAQSYSG